MHAIIAADPGISEVILSGGDPLVATDEQLQLLVEQIAAISHVRRLRIHSRLPVVLPARVTEALLDAITHADLQTVMVIHCNHANEIDASVAAALTALKKAPPGLSPAERQLFDTAIVYWFSQSLAAGDGRADAENPLTKSAKEAALRLRSATPAARPSTHRPVGQSSASTRAFACVTASSRPNWRARVSLGRSAS